jgi:hypothetical protein
MLSKVLLRPMVHRCLPAMRPATAFLSTNQPPVGLGMEDNQDRPVKMEEPKILFESSQALQLRTMLGAATLNIAV